MKTMIITLEIETDVTAKALSKAAKNWTIGNVKQTSVMVVDATKKPTKKK